ncbi:hypothetical protein QLX67_03495 [Balneolaceae bacterium ANBcel3]|nr:hypothetical protein [Balneolaceae bacterium ANBcel3]
MKAKAMFLAIFTGLFFGSIAACTDISGAQLDKEDEAITLQDYDFVVETEEKEPQKHEVPGRPKMRIIPLCNMVPEYCDD